MHTSAAPLQTSSSLHESLSLSKHACIHRNTSTAVFTGATQGIGLATLSSFLANIPEPKAFVIGRSLSAFTPTLQTLKAVNPSAELIFVEAQLSLISEVDRVCTSITSQSSSGSIDVVCMSQGYRPAEERKWTSEGLDEALSLILYSRMRLVQRLIAGGAIASHARIISIGGGGREGSVFKDDLELKANWLKKPLHIRGHLISLMSLSFDYLAKQNPSMGFVHCYPGMVKTGLLWRDLSNASWLFWALVWSMRLTVGVFGITAEESGERMLWMATTEQFAVGSFSVAYDGSASKSKELAEYRRDAHMSELVWRHFEELFERALARRSTNP